MTPFHFFLAVLVCLAWGLNAVAGKVGVTHLPPLFFTALRFSIMLAVLVPFIRPVARDQFPILLGGVFFMGALHFGLIFTGSHYSNASTVAIVNQLNVPFGSLLAMVFLSEQIGWRRWSGIAISFAGVVVFSFDANVKTHEFGIFLLVMDALAMGIGSVLLRRLSGIKPLVMLSWMSLVGTPLLWAATLLLEGGQMEAAHTAPWQGWAALAFATIAGGFIGHTAYYYLLQRYDVSLVGAMLLTVPLIGVISGVILLGDPLDAKIAVGAALTIAGVAIVMIRERRPRLLEAPDGA
jgi:O-acetylserine/cysteine efflux transporter